MRFNPDAKLDTSQIEDKRNHPPRTVPSSSMAGAGPGVGTGPSSARVNQLARLAREKARRERNRKVGEKERAKYRQRLNEPKDPEWAKY